MRPAGPRQAYLANFDAAGNLTDDLFFAVFLALGLYLTVLAAAILTGGVCARWIGWAAAISAFLVLAGDLLLLALDAAFLALLAGFALFLAALTALGVSLWQRAAGLA